MPPYYARYAPPSITIHAMCANVFTSFVKVASSTIIDTCKLNQNHLKYVESAFAPSAAPRSALTGSCDTMLRSKRSVSHPPRLPYFDNLVNIMITDINKFNEVECQ